MTIEKQKERKDIMIQMVNSGRIPTIQGHQTMTTHTIITGLKTKMETGTVHHIMEVKNENREKM